MERRGAPHPSPAMPLGRTEEDPPAAEAMGGGRRGRGAVLGKASVSSVGSTRRLFLARSFSTRAYFYFVFPSAKMQLLSE